MSRGVKQPPPPETMPARRAAGQAGLAALAVLLAGTGPAVALKLTDHKIERRLVRDPQLALGEAYMDGQLVMQQGRIYDLLVLVLSNAQWQEFPAWTKGLDATRYLVRRMLQLNSARRSQRNVAHHYDIDGSIYDLFLDPDEMVNRIDDPAYAEVQAALELRRRELLTCAGWTCNQVFGPVPDPSS